MKMMINCFRCARARQWKLKHIYHSRLMIINKLVVDFNNENVCCVSCIITSIGSMLHFNLAFNVAGGGLATVTLLHAYTPRHGIVFHSPLMSFRRASRTLHRTLCSHCIAIQKKVHYSNWMFSWNGTAVWHCYLTIFVWYMCFNLYIISQWWLCALDFPCNSVLFFYLMQTFYYLSY